MYLYSLYYFKRPILQLSKYVCVKKLLSNSKLKACQILISLRHLAGFESSLNFSKRNELKFNKINIITSLSLMT